MVDKSRPQREEFKKRKKSAKKNAQRKAEEYGFTNCHFFVQNAEAMEDLTDVSFDFINCRDVIEHLIDYHRGLDEMYRVLKDGGVC